MIVILLKKAEVFSVPDKKIQKDGTYRGHALEFSSLLVLLLGGLSCLLFLLSGSMRNVWTYHREYQSKKKSLDTILLLSEICLDPTFAVHRGQICVLLLLVVSDSSTLDN